MRHRGRSRQGRLLGAGMGRRGALALGCRVRHWSSRQHPVAKLAVGRFGEPRGRVGADRAHRFLQLFSPQSTATDPRLLGRIRDATGRTAEDDDTPKPRLMRIPDGKNAVQQAVGQNLDREAIGIGVALLDNLDVDNLFQSVGVDGLFHSESLFLPVHVPACDGPYTGMGTSAAAAYHASRANPPRVPAAEPSQIVSRWSGLCIGSQGGCRWRICAGPEQATGEWEWSTTPSAPSSSATSAKPVGISSETSRLGTAMWSSSSRVPTPSTIQGPRPDRARDSTATTPTVVSWRSSRRRIERAAHKGDSKQPSPLTVVAAEASSGPRDGAIPKIQASRWGDGSTTDPRKVDGVRRASCGDGSVPARDPGRESVRYDVYGDLRSAVSAQSLNQDEVT